MGGNPILGVFFHWLGGLSSASFYVPYKRIRLWSWEIFWLMGGLFSWLFAPWIVALAMTPKLFGVLTTTPSETLFWCWFWGAAWGIGGLTFGLTMRYLGLSLGMAVTLGITTVIGTMGPPIFDGRVIELAGSISGRLTYLGILITLVGIVLVARAGTRKEREQGAEQTKAGIAEFDLKRGMFTSILSGVMSSCMAFGIAAGEPIRALAIEMGSAPLWQGLPVLCVVLAGGLTTNALWCAYLIWRNQSLGEIVGRSKAGRPPLLPNYFLAALGGTLWYFQFFFYTMGESQMGRFGFSSWTLHMASIILFSTLWGFALREWRGVSGGTKALVWAGIAALVLATMVIGIGNMAELQATAANER